MPEQDEELARFQALMLKVLHEESDAGFILEQLKQSPDAEPYRSYVEQLDPAMVEVAAELVKKWAVGDGLDGDRTARMPH